MENVSGWDSVRVGIWLQDVELPELKDAFEGTGYQ